MEDNGIFKSSMFGFDKQSVLKYVDEMIEKSKISEAKLRSRCDELDGELTVLKKEHEDLLLKANTKQEETSKTSEETGRLQRRLEERDQKIRELEQKLTASLRENDILKDRASAAEENGRKYQQVSAQIGEVMFEAQQKGEDIISEAHKKAEEITKNSVQSVYELGDRLDNFKGDVHRLRSLTQDVLKNFEFKMSEIDLALKRAEGCLYVTVGKIAEQEDGAELSEEEQEAVENAAAFERLESDGSDEPETVATPSFNDFFAAP